MTIFAILMPSPQPRLAEEIKRMFPRDHLMITDTQWLISSTDTVVGVSAKLRIVDKDNPTQPSSGSAIVFAVSSYYGRASALIWDWIKSKLETN